MLVYKHVDMNFDIPEEFGVKNIFLKNDLDLELFGEHFLPHIFPDFSYR